MDLITNEKTMRNGYVIACKGRNNKTIFMIDRNKNRAHWWTMFIDDVLVYKDKDCATAKAKSLKYKSPRVVEYEIALGICNDQASNIIEDSMHPHDSYCLGQE